MNGTRVGLALWSAIFAGALGVVYAGFALGVNGELAVVAVTVAVGFLLMLLERVFPEQRAWHRPPRCQLRHGHVPRHLGRAGAVRDPVVERLA